MHIVFVITTCVFIILEYSVIVACIIIENSAKKHSVISKLWLFIVILIQWFLLLSKYKGGFENISLFF